MPKGFLDRHLHRSKGGGGGGGQQQESPSRLHHHDSLTSSASGSLKKVTCRSRFRVHGHGRGNEGELGGARREKVK
ncbi:hypothetical protein Pcinc_002088 [Petrolisthes cinctipes]|uniref:Uncharacterized protein n=1 Tax=Petrolisthes cinctipes TaxID=88211 RepID=A0AAE1KIJ2_PETCI|nr:hypothetical protein Pcinc_022307 [Petrolisthes cinctipes]KAK3894148.1 hypothetical protein Pcinc_002088 [Petrolisthes cinctipes]